jgi:hypothetical protein
VSLTRLWEGITRQRVGAGAPCGRHHEATGWRRRLLRKASRANGVVVAPLWEGITGQRGCPEIPFRKPHLATGVADALSGRHREATRCRWRPFWKASRDDCVALQALPHGVLPPPGCLLTRCPCVAEAARRLVAPSAWRSRATPLRASAFRQASPRPRVACPTHVRCHRIATRCSPAPSRWRSRATRLPAIHSPQASIGRALRSGRMVHALGRPRVAPVCLSERSQPNALAGPPPRMTSRRRPTHSRLVARVRTHERVLFRGCITRCAPCWCDTRGKNGPCEAPAMARSTRFALLAVPLLFSGELLQSLRAREYAWRLVGNDCRHLGQVSKHAIWSYARIVVGTRMITMLWEPSRTREAALSRILTEMSHSNGAALPRWVRLQLGNGIRDELPIGCLPEPDRLRYQWLSRDTLGRQVFCEPVRPTPRVRCASPDFELLRISFSLFSPSTLRRPHLYDQHR